MRTVLVLYFGPAQHRRALFAKHAAAWRDRGLRCVLADDYVEAADAEVFDQVIEIPPPEQVDTVVEALLRVPFDALLAQSEAALLSGALLAQRTGVRGPGLDAALHCAGKHLTRAALARAHVPQPDFALVRTAAEVRRFASGRYPVVLKGVASAMGRLVTLVRSAGAVDGAVERMRARLPQSNDIARLRAFAASAALELGCDPTDDFLVEAFAAGDPVETDGLVVAGEPKIYGVTAQVLSPPPLFYVEGYLLPADRDDEPQVRAVSTSALRALDLRDTGFSVELRATASGPRVIEVNGRLGEDDGFSELFAAAVGREPFLDAIDLALGSDPPVHSARGSRCALAFRCHYGGGVVRRVPDAVDLAASDGVQCGLAVGLGTYLHAAPHPETFPHLAWALARHPASARAAHARAAAAVAALPFEISP